MKNPTQSSTQQRDNVTRRSLSLIHWLLFLAAFALAPREALAQATPNPPGQISYQGFLTDANGVPLATNAPKNYVVSFLLYNAATGGSPIWGENQTVTVDKGYFSVLLGQGSVISGTPNTNNLTSLFTGATASQRFIGITVNGLTANPTEIQPRLQLLASPYSLLAANANAIVASTGAQVVVTSGTAVGIGQTPSANDGLDVKGNVAVTGNLTVSGTNTISGPLNSGTITTTGNDVVSGSLSVHGITDTGAMSATGAITAGSMSTTGNLTAASINSTGNLGVGGTFSSAGLISAATLAAGGGSVADGVFSMNGLGHFNDNKMYLRSGADHNHWLGYDDVYGEDGPGLYGYQGGVLGTSLSGNNWSLLWFDGGSVETRTTLDVGTYLYVNNNIYCYEDNYSYAYYTWSDKNMKQNFEEVDPKTVLSKLVQLPISKWSYTNSPSVPHIGPMAQDFAASFGYGKQTNDDKHISLNDEIGVSLVAIKGLDLKVQERDAEVEALKKQVADLKTLVDKLIQSKSGNP